jgi:hypothetical protein
MNLLLFYVARSTSLHKDRPVCNAGGPVFSVVEFGIYVKFRRLPAQGQLPL